MMRSDIASVIKTALSGIGVFSAVVGVGSDKPQYPLARVWIPGTKENLDNAPQARIDLRAAVQIETWLDKDDDGNTIDGPLYDLVDQVFAALHGLQLPGRGSQPLVVYDSPGLGEYGSDRPVIYLLQVSARVLPDAFSLTL